MKLSLSASILVLAMIGAGAASATEVLGVGTPDATQFREKVSSSDAFEITSSKIAMTHAVNPKVKNFASQMVRDHQTTTDKLVALGGLKKASLVANMQRGKDGKFAGNDLLSTAQASELNSLDSKSNADFDKTYMTDQVKGHKDAVALLQDYAKNGDNTKLKSYATEVLPTVKHHLVEAQKISAELDHGAM